MVENGVNSFEVMQVRFSLNSLKHLIAADHELLIAKLHAYWFETDALKCIYSYLKGRKQNTKINSSHNCFAKILFVVCQGSIYGPLLFNAFMCDLFYDMDDLDFASFADDNTPCFCLSDMISVLGQLKPFFKQALFFGCFTQVGTR